jgi:transcriptional regulator
MQTTRYFDDAPAYDPDVFMPRHFTEADPAAAVAMARAAGFGHLVVAGDDGLLSTPVPFLVDDDGSVVRTHLARPNPVLRTLPSAALLIVPVGDAYISPGWYPSKADDPKVVPTWNYEVVHLRGRLRAHDDDWTEQLVRDLTEHHEASMETPWSVDDAPPEYVARMLKAIVGVSLEVTGIEAKRKLSQNKSAGDLAGAADGLERRDRRHDGAVAEAMRRHDPHR